MKTSRIVCLVVLITLALCPLAAFAQDPPAGGPPQERTGPPGREAPAQEPRPYERVITKEAKSQPGVFTVHQIKDRYFYEIPAGELNKEFLWVNQIARTTVGVGYGGQALGNRVVRWERRGNKVYLRSISYEVVADGAQPIARAVQAANNDTIIQAFNIEAFGKDEAPVIDVTRLFSTEVPELSARARLRARGFDAQRSFVERISAFPMNIEVESTHTYTLPIDPPTPGQGGPQPQPTPSPFGQQGMRPGSATVVLHYSMVKLPEKPMMPRLQDERVGYFSLTQQDYGKDEQRAPRRRYIARWRLEKKDPNAELSEPVKPIVYYIDSATPEKWRPYIKRGVEKWQEAFEAAGFKNAIIAKQAPTPEEDPTFSPEDARYSVIRWLPSTIENASGPHIRDPRTGEILESDIQFYHNVMNLLRAWYFLQVGHLDARVQKLPMPDDLMGELIEYVAAHEVGHTLGFPHNMKASSTYPFEKVRDAAWVKQNGHTPTLMDYSRFNYVAQPEDKIAIGDLIPKIGPYDKFVTMWGYKPIPGAKSPDDEKATLDQWARQQDKTPWLRFSTAESRGSDPGELTEAVGDADAVKATALGIKNLERISGMLMNAATKDGENYDDLDELYGRLLGQWATELSHVTAIVGGFNSQEKVSGQAGVKFTLVPRARQQEAVAFLNANAFVAPKFALNTEILRRIEPTGAIERIRTAQLRVMGSLLSNARISRMVEQQAIDGAAAYAPTDFLGDVRRGIWGELAGASVQVDPFRRALQRSYIDLMGGKINSRTPPTDEVRALVRAELQSLSQEIGAAIAKSADRATRAHLADSRDQIAKALDPKIAPQAPAGPAGPGFPGADDEDLTWSLDCWRDYAVRIRP
jgi:hypothetical protein